MCEQSLAAKGAYSGTKVWKLAPKLFPAKESLQSLNKSSKKSSNKSSGESRRPRIDPNNPERVRNRDGRFQLLYDSGDLNRIFLFTTDQAINSMFIYKIIDIFRGAFSFGLFTSQFVAFEVLTNPDFTKGHP